MARRRKTGDYLGELRKPIIVPDPHSSQRRFSPRVPFLFTGEAKAGEAALIKRAIARKLPALFAHFGIRTDDPNKWERLALALAIKHVPGFQAVRVPGAPVKKSLDLLCRFYRYFIRAKADRKQRARSRTPNDADVCRALSKDKNFKREFSELKSASAKRLQNLVAEAKALRRAKVADDLRWIAHKRRPGPEGPSGYIRGDSAPWISDQPSAFFLKYGKSGRPRRRK